MNYHSWSSVFIRNGRGLNCIARELCIKRRLAICLEGCLLLPLWSTTAVLPLVLFRLLLHLLKIVGNRPVNNSVKGFYFIFFYPRELVSVKKYRFLINHLSTSLGIVSDWIRNGAAKMLRLCIYFVFRGAGDCLSQKMHYKWEQLSFPNGQKMGWQSGQACLAAGFDIFRGYPHLEP